MRTSFTAILAIASLGLSAAPAAFATGPGDAVPFFFDAAAVDVVPVQLPVEAPAADATPAADDAGDFAAPVAVDALDALRGGTDNDTTITNVSDVDGSVDGNTAINAVTGGNLVDGGAFGNAAGLSTVIQNSGNNVLIQNSTVVSVQFAPTP